MLQLCKSYICEECGEGYNHHLTKVMVQQDRFFNVLFNRIMTSLGQKWAATHPLCRSSQISIRLLRPQSLLKERTRSGILAARSYTKDGLHCRYPHPRAETAAASQQTFLMRRTLDFPGRWPSSPLHQPGSGLPPISTLYLIAAKSWPSGAVGGPLSPVPGSGLPRSPTDFISILSSPESESVASAPGSPLYGSSIPITSRRSLMPVRTSFVVTGMSIPARADQSPSSARLTVLFCIRAVQSPLGVLVLGGSNRHSGLSSNTVSQSSYRIPSRPCNGKAKA